MKKFNLNVFLALIAMVAYFSACNSAEVPDEAAKRLEEMVGTWNVTSVNADGSNVDVSDVSVTFNTNGNYSISGFNALGEANLNLSGVLSASGTFTVDPDNVNRVTLDGSDEKVVIFSSFNIEAGTTDATYQSAYPKAGDDEKDIRFSLSVQE